MAKQKPKQGKRKTDGSGYPKGGSYAKEITTTSVHGGPGGKWTLVVKTRDNGPTFQTWWSWSLKEIHAYDHEIDTWSYVEQGRTAYEKGLSHREFADHVIELDLQLRKERLDVHGVQVVRTKIGAPPLPPRKGVRHRSTGYTIGAAPEVVEDAGPSWEDLPSSGAGKSISLAIADIQCAVRLINGTASDRHAAVLRLEAAVQKLW